MYSPSENETIIILKYSKSEIRLYYNSENTKYMLQIILRYVLLSSTSKGRMYCSGKIA